MPAPHPTTNAPAADPGLSSGAKGFLWTIAGSVVSGLVLWGITAKLAAAQQSAASNPPAAPAMTLQTGQTYTFAMKSPTNPTAWMTGAGLQVVSVQAAGTGAWTGTFLWTGTPNAPLPSPPGGAWTTVTPASSSSAGGT